MKILIIEDDQPLRESIVNTLQKNHYAVEQADNGEDGLYIASEFPLDLAIVDLGLPNMNGIQVIEALRKSGSSVPVLILTARDSWQDKVKGLGSGADDYLTKPFHSEELLARVNALLRRSAGFSSPEITFGPIRLNTLNQTVMVDEKEVEGLTAYEYKVLEYLFLNPKKVVSKTELTEHIYEQDYDRDSNVLEVFIGRLRKKLDPEGEIKPIETLRGRGYRLNMAFVD